MAQVVNYCSQEEIDAGKTNINARIDKADSLTKMLNEWQDVLTLEFTSLPLVAGDLREDFEPVWINPPSFAVAIQVHYSARILLLLHRPSLGGLRGFVEQQAALGKYVDTICGIAVTLTDYASGVMSSQCLFIGTRLTIIAEIIFHTKSHKRECVSKTQRAAVQFCG